MKEYGVELSWTKVFSLSKTNAIETIPRPTGFRRNREKVFEMSGREMDGGHLVLQNLETQEIKDLGIVGYKVRSWNKQIMGIRSMSSKREATFISLREAEMAEKGVHSVIGDGE
uniref:Uncharacterized protein n=1 Tax=Quercus lobata TaxID=97700 RepID=A0A7N2MWQ8_QUELO